MKVNDYFRMKLGRYAIRVRRPWPQYLLLNIALGGTMGGTVDDAIFPVSMEVDYVRVYQPVR